MEKKRYFLELAYKGTHYHGWQVQDNAHTVQLEVNAALSRILSRPVDTMGSGRTDTGVHAKQQFLHFDFSEELKKQDFLKRLNSILPKDIAAYDLREVVPDAHSRFDALERSYQYYISLRKNPFQEGLSWRIFKILDVKKMNEACVLLQKNRDFKCFSKVKTQVVNFDCEIKKAHWEQKDRQLIFHITANRFLRGMVRAIVGTLVQVGEGKLDLRGFQEILASRNRSKAGISVPPSGLFLCSVIYPEHIFVK